MPTPHEPLLDNPSNKKTTSFTTILCLVLSFGAFVAAICFLSSDHINFFTNSIPSKTLPLSQVCQNAHDPKSCLAILTEVALDGVLQTDDLSPLESSLQDSIPRIENATRVAININRQISDPKVHAAVNVCLTLIDMSLDRVELSLEALHDKKSGSYNDVHTWLSGVLTNYMTCLDELDHGSARSQMEPTLDDLIDRARASLAMLVALLPNNNIQVDHLAKPLTNKFPSWVSTRDLKLLEARRPQDIRPDVVVAKDGSGDYLTVVEAVATAPNNSDTRYVIYVKRGIYEETIRIASQTKNVMLVGDGLDSTIIAGTLNMEDGTPTFETPPLAVSGDGFIGQDIWFRNTAGPAKGQAVAFRASADKTVLNRCKFDGYQDTLYPHSYRQFYRDCQISGTVDFIFGNAAVVLQKCNIVARQPLPGSSNMVTAQSRVDPNQNTGTAIQMCRVLPSADLESSTRSYFGRPWRTYARTVIMQSYIDDHIHPDGWSLWNEETDVEALYYGEYANTGPGACTDDRVNWPGFHVITDPIVAMRFTVGELIQGSSWLGSTGVDYIEGLVL